jgi:hypothetical protein
MWRSEEISVEENFTVVNICTRRPISYPKDATEVVT